MRVDTLMPLVLCALTPASAFIATNGMMRRHAPATAGAPARLPAVPCMAKKEEGVDRMSKVFSPENAGPWAILIVVFVFEGLALLPRESLPPLLQQAIPLVLGEQYARPP